MRLTWKCGEYKTLVIWKLGEKLTIPAQWTKTDVPLGKLTGVGLIL